MPTENLMLFYSVSNKHMLISLNKQYQRTIVWLKQVDADSRKRIKIILKMQRLRYFQSC